MSNRTVNTKNNYSAYKADFKTDTGLDAKTHIAEYIAYYNARINDMAYQHNFQLANYIINDLSHLPDTIRLRIAEMIRSHEVIKEAMQLLKQKP